MRISSALKFRNGIDLTVVRGVREADSCGDAAERRRLGGLHTDARGGSSAGNTRGRRSGDASSPRYERWRCTDANRPAGKGTFSGVQFTPGGGSGARGVWTTRGSGASAGTGACSASGVNELPGAGRTDGVPNSKYDMVRARTIVVSEVREHSEPKCSCPVLHRLSVSDSDCVFASTENAASAESSSVLH